MSHQTLETEQGHWILSRMGKKVLRPGGKELTLRLINGMNIHSTDEVIEFAPGIGYTALRVLKNNPRMYTGIEMNEEAAADLRKIIKGESKKIIVANASKVPLEDGCATKIYGEAMLTMHADHRKSEIIKEAYRLLKKGGLYGIHELGLTPDNIGPTIKAEVQKELAVCIKVNARPLTQSEWIALLQKEGFKIKMVEVNSMSLLETRRIIDDEGFLRTLKIGFNIIRQPAARRRINAMRCVFNKYKNHMNAVAIVAEK